MCLWGGFTCSMCYCTYMYVLEHDLFLSEALGSKKYKDTTCSQFRQLFYIYIYI
jgi:hypothetical protein